MLPGLLLYPCALLSASIVLIHLLLAAGVLANRLRDRFRRQSPGEQPRLQVSLLVTAKDEERFLPELLDSILAQTLRGFEIVLVDDRSADATGQIMERFGRKLGGRVKVLHNTREPDTRNPKQFALDLAAREASGDILVFTDADCVVPPLWAEGLLAYFSDPRVGLVFGQLALSGSAGFLERFQAYDQPLIHQWNSATAGLGMPGSAFGNNLACRRVVLEEAGGFLGLGDTLTEDAALVSAAAKRGWRVRVATDPSTMITTRPQSSWREFLFQHLRWNTGAFFHRDPGTRWPYRFIVLFLTASVLVIPLCPWFPLLAMLPAASFIAVGLMGFLAGALYRDELWSYLLWLLPNTLYFMGFYALVTILSMLQVVPEWKGRRLAGKGKDAYTI
jgi:cellulose synthase/poly-beta-1,6-N-acetylglucosamine synthase-like glycosyltransferase